MEYFPAPDAYDKTNLQSDLYCIKMASKSLLDGGIDHSNLESLMKDLSTSSTSHEFFMDSYTSMFLPEKRPKAGIPSKATKSYMMSHPLYGQKPRSRLGYRKTGPGSIYTDPFSKVDDAHSDVSSATSCAKDRIRRENLVSELYEILVKFPFERSQKEHKRVHELFVDLAPSELISAIRSIHQSSILSNITRSATLATYPDTGVTVFGNSALFMIMKGSVKPLTMPYLNVKSDRAGQSTGDDIPVATPILKRRHFKLGIGDFFGTYEKIEDKPASSKIYSVMTCEPCVFLKVSTHEIERILLKMKDNEQSKRMSVIQACRIYKNWPNLSVKALATCIEWQHYPPNTVVFGEGEVCPFIGFIKSGHCEVYKSVEAIKNFSNHQIKMKRQVCMGTLESGDSIGETSLLFDEVLPCTVVTRSALDMGVIKEERLKELDETTRTLLSQSAKSLFPDLTEDAIEQKFVAQEMKSDWEKLKQRVLLQTVNYCGIRPGYGKWSH